MAMRIFGLSINRSRGLVFLAAILLAGGCESYSELGAKPPSAVAAVDRNYQAVYASTLSAMRRCLRPGAAFFPSPSAVTLDAQLYPDLGYGEIAHGMAGLAPGLLTMTRIERVGSGTRVSVTTGNQGPGASANSASWAIYWARGGSDCPTLRRLAPPAS
jgi:hypothetical protein